MDDFPMLLEVRTPLNSLDVAASLSQEFVQSAAKPDAKAGVSEYEIERLRDSELLSLIVPKEYGGIGATWVEALKIVYALSKANHLIGQLYGNHLILTTLAHICGTLEQKERYYQYTAGNHCFWANAIDTWDTTLKLTSEGDHFRLNGAKTFNPVVAAADLRVFSVWQEGVSEPFFVILPKDRPGVFSSHNWNNVDLGEADSVSFRFHNVIVEKGEIFNSPNFCDRAFTTLQGIITQLTKTYVSLGIGQSALEVLQEYRKTISQSPSTSGGDSATQDTYTLGHYSDLWLELTTAIRLADYATELIQAAWEKEFRLTSEERGEVASAVFSAEAFAARISLEITTHILKCTNNPPTGTTYNLERYGQELSSFGGVSMPWQGVAQPWKLTYFPSQKVPC
ncbi:MAG: acyl-CoA dehydrogenase family protein [Cyanobacteriota bacterium]